MKNIQINIFTNDLVWKATIDDIISFVHRTSWHEIVNSELTISRTAQNIQEMQIGRILIVNNDLDKVLIVEEMTANVAEDIWNINLIPLKAMLNYRIAHPIDSGTFVNLSQAEVMMNLVSRNLITQSRDIDRKFWNADLNLNRLSIASMKTYGDLIDYTVDWETGLLGDALTEISKMFEDIAGKYPIGWNIYIKSTLDGFQMNTYQASDRSIGQSINPPVVFSEDFNNIRDATYVNSLRDWNNMAYVTWNDGTNDQTTAIASTRHGRSTGFNRKETIIDSSKETANEVVAEGKAELIKRPIVESFTAEILDNPNTISTFNEDWFLGDIVTVQTKALRSNQMISVNTQIIQVEEIFDNGEYSINATFGQAKLSIIKKIKQAINQKR